MYECVVGYTPFYADDPVMTCRKILRWQQVGVFGSRAQCLLERKAENGNILFVPRRRKNGARRIKQAPRW